MYMYENLAIPIYTVCSGLLTPQAPSLKASLLLVMSIGYG